jgi:RND family efflux transporter MFP subunit
MKNITGIRRRIWPAKKPIGIFIYLFFSVVIALVTGCRDKVSPGKADVKHLPVSGVTVVELKLSPIDDYYETAGTVKAKNISVIASKIMGSVTSVSVLEGQRVSRGQPLLSIDDSDLLQRVNAAKSAVEAAKQQKQLSEVTLSRYEKLYKEKALSQQEFDQMAAQKNIAESEYERAKAMLRESETVHSYARVTAPFTGVVTSKKIDSGSMAMPGMQLLTVEDTSSYQVETAVDEKLFANIRAGGPVILVIDALNQTFKGKVAEVVPSVDPMSRTFTVKIALGGQGLKTGLYVKVRIPTGARDALIIPVSAIVEKGQLTGVYAVDSQGVISYRLIRFGKRFEDNVEILSGLRPGDKIIVTGVERAVDGGIIAATSQAGSVTDRGK